MSTAVDRRRQILEAAVRVFARQGYHSSRVSDIADEAGVAYGLMYHYFRSKDELLDLFKIVHRDFYYDPRVILRTLMSVENMVDLKRLAKGGAQLVIVCRNVEKGAAVKRELEGTFDTRVDVVLADFSRLADVRKAVAELLEKYIKACELRKRWVGIDGKRMKAYAERLLAESKNVKEVV